MTLSCFSNDVFSLSVQKRTMIIFGQILTIWAIVIVVRKAFYTKAIIVFGDGFGSFFECIRRRRAFSWAATEALSPWPRTSVDMDETLDLIVVHKAFYIKAIILSLVSIWMALAPFLNGMFSAAARLFVSRHRGPVPMAKVVCRYGRNSSESIQPLSVLHSGLKPDW